LHAELPGAVFQICESSVFASAESGAVVLDAKEKFGGACRDLNADRVCSGMEGGVAEGF